MPITLAAYALLAITIVVSSFISGVFGMAGGMILLGVLLNYFDVPSAMILFSIIQFCANGWRAWQWRQYVRWPIFYKYLGERIEEFAEDAHDPQLAREVPVEDVRDGRRREDDARPETSHGRGQVEKPHEERNRHDATHREEVGQVEGVLRQGAAALLRGRRRREAHRLRQ